MLVFDVNDADSLMNLYSNLRDLFDDRKVKDSDFT